ncbi:ABC transporter substrate-binding protein [Actinosynnema sp. NPDC050436]|uniref:ABC transporter substrate-binding protein n=1 Tax=Actinosynnema sp. NPDC050436 TaxID=3155659 RepID=UPI0033FF56D8
MRRTARRASGAVAAAFLVVATAPGAHAVDQSKGQPGFCPSGTGVTVVIDFQQLGGTTLVRCNPQTTRGTGLDAMKGAGFQVNGVQRWGEAFICRIENRPSAVEAIPVKGNEGYQEACLDTPPAAGYWSYWHAGNNCAWEYSQWGVKNRKFVPGGFEGWSFSLNATADTNPVPRVAAVRPGTEGQPCVAPDEGRPSSDDPDEQQPDLPSDPQGEQGRTGGRGQDTEAPEAAGTTARGTGTAALPPPKPRQSPSPKSAARDPGENVAFDGGQNAPDINQVVKEQSGASDFAPWAAAGLVALLGAGTLLMAGRRRRARDS